ncbi:MAG: hypothetical protein IMY72_13110 [Bacteroidetes bacterium]|nr:hypothetical protein [Bacteroidota bacterium]
MATSRKVQKVSIKAVRSANAKLMSKGVVVKHSSTSTSGGMTVRIERGTINHKRVVTNQELNKAYKVALKGNA